jgi:hypothetical protein
MIDVSGVRKIGIRTLSVIPFFWFLTRAHYSDPMPHQLEGINLGDKAKIKGRGVVTAMLVATVVGTLVGFWVLLHTGYRYRSAGFGHESFNRLQNWLTYSIPPDMTGVGLFAYGLLFGIFLMFMRTQFLWWPLHPIGYAVSSTYSMRDWWSMFFYMGYQTANLVVRRTKDVSQSNSPFLRLDSWGFCCWQLLVHSWHYNQKTDV